MAFTNLDAGAARTRIRVQKPVSVDDGGGNEIDTWEDVSGSPSGNPGGTFAAVWRRKLTRFDSAIDNRDNERVYAPETAVVTVRFTKRITASCRVFRIGDDGGAWSIIGTPERSVDGGWLEFTVERKVKAL